jgi:predicted phosphodiesterase
MLNRPQKRPSLRLSTIAGAACIAVLLTLLSAGCSVTGLTPSPREGTPLPPTGEVPTSSPITPTDPPTPPPSPTPSPTPTATPSPTPTAQPITLDEAPAAVAYRLPLVAQHVTGTGATLFFELGTPVEGVLLYWPIGEELHQAWVELPPTGARHQITLDGLTPGVTYQATVAIQADAAVYCQPYFMGEAWGPIHFRTPAGQEPLRVGVIGDSGFGHQATYTLAGEMAAHDLDFVLHTGDVVYCIYENTDPFEAYALKWFKPLSPLLHQMPVYPVIGNHDVEAAAQWQGLPFYYYAFPPFTDPRFEPSDYGGRNQWYAFAYEQVQFVMLDTQAFFGEGGQAEQNAWLAERLADGRFPYTIPVLHVPPYTSGLHPNDGIPVRKSWVPEFEAANVPLVLSGHDHNYQRLVINDLTYVISGGGSLTLYDLGEALPESEFFAKQTHFVLLEIYADRIDLQAIALGGEVLDQATILLK